MSGVRLLVAAFIVGIGLLVIPAVGVVADEAPGVGVAQIADSEANASSTDDTESTSMGGNVSAFMQSGAADAESSVDDGMFEAAYNQSDEANRSAVVADRTAALEDELTELEAEREALRENEPTMNPAAYEARMTQLAVRIDSIERAANSTESRANAHGTETQPFESIRTGAAELRGPEVAAATPAQGAPPPGQSEQGDGDPGQSNATPGEPGRPNLSDHPSEGGQPADGNQSGAAGHADDGAHSSDDAGPPDEGSQSNAAGHEDDVEDDSSSDTGPPSDGGPSDDAGHAGAAEDDSTDDTEDRSTDDTDNSGPPDDGGPSDDADPP